MDATHKFCPYPGLRPFNEDESIFFKGRDQQILKIISQLEVKKFLMVNGASGDGKSSLVYAGLIPLAQAGLFKAQYPNWVVADFRPERTPMANLVEAVAKHFIASGFTNEEIGKELSFGYSSLLDLYKKSHFYIDTEAEDWKEMDDAAKKLRRRRSANLLIIADQFEEFFTNPENYKDGIASAESQTTVNLLVETAKLAEQLDLPVYVVCTMRSDYVGQCAAFRGLPEMIGYSQFFVPRLRRNEYQQVIEEPAKLNGDKITRRLSEKLLNDLNEGYDQLPILQHALNQIWKLAGKGEEELDLIHYAMAGGMKGSRLPIDQRERFAKWKETLNDEQRKLLEHPSLENVLNAHANNLGNKVQHKYHENGALIVEGVFKCLTKIDNSRAVRNRMTLTEIAETINLDGVAVTDVDNAIRVFREQGNTFIRPFIDKGDKTPLSPDTVLDITHESLIRNWDKLEHWAVEENDNLSNFRDFEKQLNRWRESGKSANFLLPIGPLNFFETWFEKSKPNAHWVTRYDDRNIPLEQKLSEARDLIADAKEFIRKSARKLFITRTVMKYGAQKIAIVFSLVALVIACGYYYYDFTTKQNDYVLADVEEKAMDLFLNDKKASPETRAKFIIEYERLHPGNALRLVQELKFDSIKYAVAGAVINNSKEDIKVFNPDSSLFFIMAQFMDTMGTRYMNNSSNLEISKDVLYPTNGLVYRILQVPISCKYYSKYAGIRENVVQNLGKYLFKRISAGKVFNEYALESSLRNQFYSNDSNYRAKLSDDYLSYFATIRNSKDSIEKQFNGDKNIAFDDVLFLTNSFGGNIDSALANFSVILDRGDYSYDSYLNGYLMPFVFTNQSPEFYIKFFNLVLSKETKQGSNARYSFPCFLTGNWYDTQAKYAAFEGIINYFKGFEKFLTTQTFSSNDERNFNFAYYHKLLGNIYETLSSDPEMSRIHFQKAIETYNFISNEFRNKPISPLQFRISETDKYTPNEIFILPKTFENGSSIVEGYLPVEQKSIFLDCLIKTGLQKYLRNSKDINFILNHVLGQIERVGTIYTGSDYMNFSNFKEGDSKLIIKYIGTLGANKEKDFPEVNWDLVYLVDAYINKAKLEKIDIKKLYSLINKHSEKWGGGFFSAPAIMLMEIEGYPYKKANEFLNCIDNPFAYRTVSSKVIMYGKEYLQIENLYPMLDTLLYESEKDYKFGYSLLRMTGFDDSKDMNKVSQKLISVSEDRTKIDAIANFILGLSWAKKYYAAVKSMPDYTSRSNRLYLYTQILKAENYHRDLKLYGGIERMEIEKRKLYYIPGLMSRDLLNSSDFVDTDGRIFSGYF